PDRFVPFLQRLAEVIDAAHEVGIVHRDIKPANVMVLARAGALFPKLLDFGVAALLEDVRGEDGGLGGRRGVGSPPYVPPEGWLVTTWPMPESDLYSLGILAYEALSGRTPFDGPSLDAMALAHQTSPVPWLDGRAPGPLDAVIQRALAKNP